MLQGSELLVKMVISDLMSHYDDKLHPTLCALKNKVLCCHILNIQNPFNCCKIQLKSILSHRL
jgi:hypothetical protein